ncbi:14923_t:CDS:2 [Acaulospora colombiana]|uniref:14923_t:CDS:1 n=1 Tax=Acaulospora colombiana TaxID=27376 RepID=A0ACA9KKZ0_9GLOM|nr:14923_t:CDS:2 [Acaulospora colombiana]
MLKVKQEEDEKFIKFAVGEDYERERRERIEQNREILAKLGLDVESLRQLKPQKVKPKKEFQVTTQDMQRQQPTRRSPRIQKKASRIQGS